MARAHDNSSSHTHAESSSQANHQGHHHEAPKDFGRAFLLAIALNSGFVAIEFFYGWIANSTSLMADAGHNLSDVLGLALAWGASILAKKIPKGRYTYGLRSSSILAALANAMFLMVACGAIGWEAAQRISAPPVVAGMTVMVVAGVGIAINGFSAWLFMRGSKGDINIRGAYLHMAADAAVSLGVVVAGLAMSLTGWFWLDPITTLVIAGITVLATWGLLRESVHLALNAVPPNIEIADVDSYLRQCAGVTEIHDLHIWGMSTTESALTVHLVMPRGYPGDAFIDGVSKTLKDRFSIQHSTLQIEQGITHHTCGLNP
jgi:cobalt-zinc-cadmium efflux system protein